jgi:hypothetical protein
MVLSKEALSVAEACLAAECGESTSLSIVRIDRLDAHRVELVIQHNDGPFLAIEWGEKTSEDLPAFARGEHYISSYNRRPGAWDLEKKDTPDSVRSLAFRICTGLANSHPKCSLGSSLNSPPSTEPTPDVPERIDAILEACRIRLAQDLGTERFANPEGWRVDEIRSFRYWRLVADIRLTSGERNLGFLVFPTDPVESVYARTLHHDIVYYSDDIAIAQHHDELYLRDHLTIDRFVAWFGSWDREIQAQ